MHCLGCVVVLAAVAVAVDVDAAVAVVVVVVVDTAVDTAVAVDMVGENMTMVVAVAVVVAVKPIVVKLAAAMVVAAAEAAAASNQNPTLGQKTVVTRQDQCPIHKETILHRPLRSPDAVLVAHRLRFVVCSLHLLVRMVTMEDTTHRPRGHLGASRSTDLLAHGA
jgi:hypothetical protein